MVFGETKPGKRNYRVQILVIRTSPKRELQVHAHSLLGMKIQLGCIHLGTQKLADYLFRGPK